MAFEASSSPSPVPAFSRRVKVGVAVLVGAVILLQALAVLDYGRLPRSDYWGLIARLCDEQGFKDTPASFFEARINQHRVTLPALMWRMNIALSGGDNRVTGLVALGLLAALLYFCFARLPNSLTARERFGGAALLTATLLGAQHSYNLAFSFGGTHSFLADFFTVAGLALYTRSRGSGERARVEFTTWLAIWALGLAGILSFSSALLMWPALAVAWWWQRRPATELVSIAGGLFAATAIFLHGFKGAAGGLPNAGLALEYLFTFLGALPRFDQQIAFWLGLAGLIAALVLVTWMKLRAKLPASVQSISAFWLALLIYAAGNGLLAGLGRAASGGAKQAMAIRYAVFPSLFWAALTALAWIAFSTGNNRPLRTRLIAPVMLAVMLFFAGQHGLKDSSIFRERAHWQQVVEDQMRNDAWDLPLMSKTVSSFPKTVIANKNRPLFQSIGHVPWNRPAHWPDRQLDPRNLGDKPEGAFTEIVATANADIVRVGGWVAADAGVREVVFGDTTGKQRSIIHFWQQQKPEPRLYWSGIVRWHDDWKTWTPFVIDHEQRLRPLKVPRYVAVNWQEMKSERAEAY